MEENDVIEIDFRQILEATKKVFKPCLAIILLCSIVFFAVTYFILPKEYTATAKLIVVQKSNSQSQQVTYSDIQASQKLVTTYSEIMKSEAISDDVIRNLKLDIDSEKYNKIVTISSANDTEVINVSVVTEDPQLSADLANEVVEVFTRKIYSIMQIENVTILNEAKIPDEKSGPNTLKNTLLGFAVGIVLSGCLVMFVLLTDRKVKSEEEVKKIFNYPIIGIIPEVELKVTGKGQKK